MPTHGYSLFTARLITFLLAALAAGSAAYWGLKLWGAGAQGMRAPVAGAATAPTVDSQAVARALGAGLVAPNAAPQPAPMASRLTLLGVVADATQGGAALISVDGKPPRPYRVGAKVEDRLLVQSVSGRRAMLGAQPNGPAEVTLELPALSK